MTTRQPAPKAKVPVVRPMPTPQVTPKKVSRMAQPTLKGATFEEGKAQLKPTVRPVPRDASPLTSRGAGLISRNAGPTVPTSQPKTPSPQVDNTPVNPAPAGPQGGKAAGSSPDVVNWKGESINVKMLQKMKFDDLIGLKESLDEVKGRVQKVAIISKTVDILVSGHASMSPADTIRSLGALVDATKDLTGIPGISQFLEMYSKAIDMIADRVGEIAATIQKGEASAGYVIHPGTWPGGWPLFNYMKTIESSASPTKVPSAVMEWVKDNRSQLLLVTGADPGVERRTRAGLNRLAKDDENAAAFQQWFFDHRKEIRQFAYGDAEFV